MKVSRTLQRVEAIPIGHADEAKDTQMTGKAIRIELLNPRGGVIEEPVVNAQGYCLGDPKFGPDRHLAKHAVYVKTLAEAAELVAAGYSLRMGGAGKRGSLISPASLRVIRG
jgi:hypothetical protein